MTATDGATGLASGYAAGLLEVARAEGALDQVSDELYRFARAVEGSDQLRQTLADATLPPERRQAIVEDLLGRRTHRLTASFVSFLVAAGRGRDLADIVEAVVQKAAAQQHKEVAEVRSAAPLDADVQQRLAAALAAGLGKQVEVKVVVDPAVLGGVAVRVGDTVIDGTIRHRLDQLREAL